MFSIIHDVFHLFFPFGFSGSIYGVSLRLSCISLMVNSIEPCFIFLFGYLNILFYKLLFQTLIIFLFHYVSYQFVVVLFIC